jgi:hypothetical protein
VSWLPTSTGNETALAGNWDDRLTYLRRHLDKKS